jgi:hypothetical protein
VMRWKCSFLKLTQASQCSQYAGLILDFSERLKVILNVLPIELALVAQDHSFGIVYIQRA